MRAQFELALLTHPRTLPPSLAGKVVSSTSSSSAASAGVYSNPMLALTVDPAWVLTSGSALPAFLHTHPACGLCTAYLLTTSRMRAYSSDAERNARFRSGML